jgi:hypothetical protein
VFETEAQINLKGIWRNTFDPVSTPLGLTTKPKDKYLSKNLLSS